MEAKFVPIAETGFSWVEVKVHGGSAIEQKEKYKTRIIYMLDKSGSMSMLSALILVQSRFQGIHLNQCCCRPGNSMTAHLVSQCAQP